MNTHTRTRSPTHAHTQPMLGKVFEQQLFTIATEELLFTIEYADMN